MTELLVRAFDEASKLSPEVQDDLARQLLEDLRAESRWDETLAKSQSQLERLADKALEELRAGQAQEMGIDEL